MMVDDDVFIMDLISSYLADDGYENFIAICDSTLAIEAILKEKPDLVLLDLSMPEVDGFEILKALRDREDTRFLPIIVLTSSTDADKKLRTLELGATDFLPKPVDPSELILRLRNTLNAKAHMERIEHYDSLTGLPNRKLLRSRLANALVKCREANREIALLKVALNRLKHVNESFGTKFGNRILKESARRLSNVLRLEDTIINDTDSQLGNEISHLDTNEFCVLITRSANAEVAEKIAKRIHTAFAEPFFVDEKEIFLTINIGIVLAPTDGSETDELLKNLDVTTDHAKQEGINNHHFYSEELNKFSAARFQLETDLQKALAANELEIYYQPKISTTHGMLVGAEALLRWNHPIHGKVSPTEFIPLAEELELILSIGEWTLTEACKQFMLWQDTGLHPFNLSVNVSPLQFTRQDFYQVLVNALHESKLDAHNLTLEITESMLQDGSQSTVELLRSIESLGAAISIGDFGTGYSSLSSIKNLPISELKIDRSFIADITESADSAAIIKAIVAMASSLGLKVVAEGVETRQQFDFMEVLNCDIIQGYYFSEPLSADEFWRYATSLAKRNSNQAKKA